MNNERNKSFEKKLHSLSGDFELTPAADSWRKIESQLEQKRKRRFLFWLIPVGVFVLLAGVFVLSKHDKNINETGKSKTLSETVAKESNQKISEASRNKSQTTFVDSENKVSVDNAQKSNEKARNNSATVKADSLFSSLALSKKRHQKSHRFYASINNASLHSKQDEPNEQSGSEISTSSSNNENQKIEMIRMEMRTSVLESNFNLNPLINNFQPIEKAKRKSSWSIGISYKPMLSNRKVSYDLESNNQSIIPHTSNQRKDKNLLTNNLGADIYYHFNEKYFLHSGLYGVNYGEESFYDNRVYDVTTIIGAASFSNYADYIIPGSEMEYTNSYNLIQVPLSFGIALRTGTKTALTIETGFAYGYLYDVKALQLTTINDSLQLKGFDDAQLNCMNRHQFFGNASVGFNWFFAKKFSLNNGFNLQYQFTDMYKKGELQSQHNYMYGLHTSVIFHFK